VEESEQTITEVASLLSLAQACSKQATHACLLSKNDQVEFKPKKNMRARTAKERTVALISIQSLADALCC